MLAFILPGVLTLILGVVLYNRSVFNLAFEKWYGGKGADVREKYRATDVRRNPRDIMRDAFRNQLMTALKILALGLGLGLLVFFTNGGGDTVESVERPDFGEGEISVELMANLECEEESRAVSFDVGEKIPSDDEVENFFATAAQAALVTVLGDNEDFSHVTQNLDLITSTDQGIEITWQTSASDMISTLGVLGNIPMEGVDVTLTMTMSYGDFTRSFEIPVTVWPDEAATQDEDALSAYISEEIAGNEELDDVPLPTEYEGETLILYQEKNNMGQNLALLGCLAALVIWLGSESKLEEKLTKRRKGLEEDYPDIVSRFSILFSAGLTVPAAWKRLVADYEGELERKYPTRYGYEELRITALELNNAGYSDQIFYDFGKRCGNYRYMKLADVLDQSMKKGTVQLTEYMEQEAVSAFELRKLQAAKTGEEAGTKLLLPMMMMFGLVIAMVVVPAWSGMNF